MLWSARSLVEAIPKMTSNDTLINILRDMVEMHHQSNEDLHNTVKLVRHLYILTLKDPEKEWKNALS